MSVSVEWRSLWRLVEGVDGGTTTYSFISLEDSDERYAHRIAADAPVAQVAQVYYGTRDRVSAMSTADFAAYCEENFKAEQAVRAAMPEKADAFYQALTDERKARQRKEVDVEETVNHYLYDEQEKP